MNEILTLVAEIAVGFTGFAAIASALGQSPSVADARLDRLRLRNLVETGVVVVVMAIVPLVLLEAESGTEWAWHVSAGILLTAVVTLAIVHGGRNRGARVSELAGYSHWSAVVLWTLAVSSLGLLVVALLAPRVLRIELAYVAALVLLTVILGVYFVRIAASLLTHKLGGPS
jgi:hypothetical protein